MWGRLDDESLKQKLLREKRVRLDECFVLKQETIDKATEVHRKCPLCGQGVIVEYYDHYILSYDWGMRPCAVCGLTGGPTGFRLETAKPEYRNP